VTERHRLTFSPSGEDIDIAARGGKPNPNDAVGIREDDVRAVLDRNLLSTILTCQAVAQEMMKRRQGRLIC
jgi:3-oxoacyl-[acyl-carrier protein] reductase